MKTKSAAVILALVVVISIVCTYWVFTYLLPYEVQKFDMYLTVGNYTGFNVDASAVFFGTIPPSGTGRRYLILTNTDMKPKQVLIKAFGKLADWVSVEDNAFILNARENRTLAVTVTVPPDAEYGNYTGTLDIYFKRIGF